MGVLWGERQTEQMPTPPPPMVNQISKCTVKAAPVSESWEKRRCHLTPWDLTMLSAHYIQKGLLFANLPPSLDVDHIVDRLKTSLSLTLHHFYPVAGRLATEKVYDSKNKVSGMIVFIDCNGEGAEFIHATAHEISVADVLAPSDDVPSFVQSFFPLDGAFGHDGHTMPLLAVQLTELADGIFLGFTFNHVVGDGTSYWHLFNAWAEICRSERSDVGKDVVLSRPPVHDRWFIDGTRPPIELPFAHHDEFIERFSPPALRERIFHFTSASIARLKAKANDECKTDNISSFQALSSLLWRCITRVRRLPEDHFVNCRLSIQNRARLRPTLSPDYFGNSIYAMSTTTTAGELLAHGLGWAAALLHDSVAAHTDERIREKVSAWMAAPLVYGLSMFDEWSVMMGSSPRFDMYGCEFGWGRAVAARSGTANKFCGKVSSYPGCEGGGSVDLEVCLKPHFMTALESDPEFMAAASTSPL